MKNKILGIALLLCAAAFGANCQTNAPNVQKPLFRMIKVIAPDSIIFSPAKGEEITGISVSLISEGKSMEGKVYCSGEMRLHDGGMYFTENSILTAKNFNAPAGFKAKKIKFETGDKIVYYDIIKKTWTSSNAQ